MSPAREGEAPRVGAPPGDPRGDPRGGEGRGRAPRPEPAREELAREEVSAGGIVFRCCADEAGRPRVLYLLIRDSYRNWGFPKGHLEPGELPDGAALREVREETGLAALDLAGTIATIDWYFRFRGQLVHKVCHFFLMRTEGAATCPQREEGITACRWAPFEEAVVLVAYANAREVLRRADLMVRTAVLAPLAARGGVGPASPAAAAPDDASRVRGAGASADDVASTDAPDPGVAPAVAPAASRASDAAGGTIGDGNGGVVFPRPL